MLINELHFILLEMDLAEIVLPQVLQILWLMKAKFLFSSSILLLFSFSFALAITEAHNERLKIENSLEEEKKIMEKLGVMLQKQLSLVTTLEKLFFYYIT